MSMRNLLVLTDFDTFDLVCFDFGSGVGGLGRIKPRIDQSESSMKPGTFDFGRSQNILFLAMILKTSIEDFRNML